MKKKLGLLAMLIAMLIASAAMADCEREEDHRYGSWKTKTSATCTRQGHDFRYCSKCDHWEQRWTSKLPHTPGEMTVTKEPTCTANGTGEHTCMDCGKTRRESIGKLGHDWGKMTVTKAPTCTKTGTGEETCLRCGRVQKSTLEKTEHTFGQWTVTREPLGKRKGLRTSTCSVCERVREETFFHEGTLYEGMEPCEEVVRMQEKLRDLGFYKGSIRSGQFGDLTTSAVARFQRSLNLEGSGIADPQTLSALTIAWEKATGKTDVVTLKPEEMEAAQQVQAIEK